jgi:hypothetical protein
MEGETLRPFTDAAVEHSPERIVFVRPSAEGLTFDLHVQHSLVEGKVTGLFFDPISLDDASLFFEGLSVNGSVNALPFEEGNPARAWAPSHMWRSTPLRFEPKITPSSFVQLTAKISGNTQAPRLFAVYLVVQP